MAYLRGNSVVDGNLYVEGDLLVRGIKPAENGRVAAVIDENQGLVKGRHFRSKSGETGDLIDSAILETRPQTTPSQPEDTPVPLNEVEFQFTWDNTSTPNDVDKITIINSVSKFYITENIDSNTGLSNDLKAMNMSIDPVTGTPIMDEISISDIDKYADKITTWRYIQS
jgi:hypothetical protein